MDGRPQPEKLWLGSVEGERVLYIKEKLGLFLTIVRSDPIQAINFVPRAAGGITAV